MKGQGQQAPGANPLGPNTPNTTAPNPFAAPTGTQAAPGGGYDLGGSMGPSSLQASMGTSNPLNSQMPQSNFGGTSGTGSSANQPAYSALTGTGPAGADQAYSGSGTSLTNNPVAPDAAGSNTRSVTTTPSNLGGAMGNVANQQPATGGEMNVSAPPPSASPAYNPFDSRNANYNTSTGYSPGTGVMGAPPGQAPTNAGSGPMSNEWGSVTNTIAPAGSIQQNIAGAGPLQRNLDTSNVPGLVGGDALAGQMQNAQDAAYKNATGYLDPQWQNQQTALQNQLANQGVMQNSEAWNKAMDDFGRQKQFAYQQAQSNAVNQGLAAQGQLFNQGLQANQNAFGQDLSSGQFTNSAQGQQFTQNLAQQQAQNAAQGQQFGQNLQGAQFANAAQNQLASQGLQNRQIADQLQGTQAMANAQMGAASTSANASMQNVMAQLAAQQQQNQFNNSMAVRNQDINELLLQQQNPLQMLNSLNGGQGVQQPNFTSTPGANVSGTDIMQAIQNGYQGQLNGYNASTGNANSSNAAMASIIAAMLCDRRLKKNIRQIGMLESGCALYEFEYLWGEKAVGPMADEVERVRPEAVFTLSTGHKVVNFARL